MNPQQPYQPPRRAGGQGNYHDELHLSQQGRLPGQFPGQNAAQIPSQIPGQFAPRDYSAPHSKLDPTPASQPPMHNYPNSSPVAPLVPSVPNVLTPGRPPILSTSAALTLPTMQLAQSAEFQTPTQAAPLSLSHAYSRSSPAAPYDGTAGGFYPPFTPTTPSGPATGQFMVPSDSRSASRTVCTTPLGLADIRPRADSVLSDGFGSSQYELANTQPGPGSYLAPWPSYAFDWCKWAAHGNSAGKLAIGSYLEDGHNYIQIAEAEVVLTPPDAYLPGASKYSLTFTKVAEATHSYPVTRLLWEPPSSQKQSTDLLATSGDHLRLWSLPSDSSANPGASISNRTRDGPAKLTPLALLSNSKTPDHTAPLTSLDWNTVTPNLIITSSIDTTCTIWDIPSLTAKTQLIAHDKEVYDVRFCANSVDVFVSCGQDGSVRMFDLRSLEHSTIIYEPTGKDDRDANGGRISPTLAQQTMAHPPPLLRLATSPHDQQLLATFAQDSNVIRILDVRQPGQALLELRGHGGPLNCVEWSPTRRGTLASGADDCQVLIWDLTTAGAGSDERGPAGVWQCESEVSNLGWVPQLGNREFGEWLGVSGGRGIWGVRMY